MKPQPPLLLALRSSTTFILSTVALALFTDLFLYGLIIPTLPFILTTRLHIPQDEAQKYISLLLTSYALSSLIFSLPAGLLIDRLPTRGVPFFGGLVALIGSTILLGLGRTVGVLVVARVLQGVSAAVVWTVGLMLVQDTVGRARLGTALGSIFGFIGVGNLVAPVVGGVVYDKAGDGAVFGLGLGLLGLDLVMRVVMVERGTAELWGVSYDDDGKDKNGGNEDVENAEGSSSSTGTMNPSNETSPLLTQPPIPSTNSVNEDNSKYILPNPLPKYLPTPLLYILFTSPRLLASTLATLLQSTIVSFNDATIPLHALHLFHFTSLHSGLLFIPLLTPLLAFGPISGFLIDKYGTKPLSTFGFLYLSIPIFLLRIPHSSPTPSIEVVKYATILFFCGVGSSTVSAVALVEGSDVVARYHECNPEAFGERGPFASLFAWNSVLSNGGLALGPLLVVGLRGWMGYAGMTACLAGACLVVGGLCFLFVGEKGRGRRGK